MPMTRAPIKGAKIAGQTEHAGSLAMQFLGFARLRCRGFLFEGEGYPVRLAERRQAE